jgi:hypothetical protein
MRHESVSLLPTHGRAEDEQRQADIARRGRGRFLSGLYGMLAEILFILGLVSIGFLISLLGGW